MQQRVVRKINARHNVGSVEGHLFSFSKEVVGVAIQRHLADTTHRYDLFRNDLRGIEQVKVKTKFVFLLDDLNSEFPLGIIAILNRFPKIAPMKVRILTGNFLRFIPEDCVQTEQRFPVKLHETGLSLIVNKSESMNAKAFHHSQASGYRAI